VLTSEQAKLLSVGAYRQISPHLENSCLRVSANVSYAQACEDVYYLTGVRVPAKTQQRLVHGHDFRAPRKIHSLLRRATKWQGFQPQDFRN
jgi:hypothetical protein